MLLKKTESLCPICLRRISARIVGESDDAVYMKKSCPIHGEFNARIWKGVKSWILWDELNDWQPEHTEGEESVTGLNKGCPFDCGLCPQHLRKACIAVVEITNRCNLNCPVCFASANERYVYDARIDAIERMFKTLLRYESKATTPTVQISGGEPTVRDDLPEIVALAKDLGIEHIMINTNGVRLSNDKKFLYRLKESGASVVYLQFDGVSDDVYLKLRGANLMKSKVKAVKNCAEVGVGVVLVPTIVNNVNLHQVGNIITFAKKWMPTVRGVHFQPVSYFGRYFPRPDNSSRVTIPDMLRAIEEQTNGEIRVNNFAPINLGMGCESHCSFTSVSILKEDGKLLPVSSFPTGEDAAKTENSTQASFNPKHSREIIRNFWKSFQACVDACTCKFYTGDFGELAECLQEYYLTISGMPFQDVWNIDTSRCRKCCVHIVTPDSRLIPFCVFNITNIQGETLYRDQVYMEYVKAHAQNRAPLNSSWQPQ